MFLLIIGDNLTDLDIFFKPKSVAVIGASRNPERVGHIILKRMIEIEYPGKLYPVNPKAEKILGIKCYSSVEEIPDEIYLAVIALRADLTPSALEESAKKGAKGAIVISGGFSEIGNYGLEAQLLSIAKKYGIRIIGPNCLGVFDPKNKIDTLFLPKEVIPRPRAGEVSIITQSGSLGSTLLTMIRKEGRGLSKFISYGNRIDVDEGDLVSYLSEDNDTKVIAAYIEGVIDGRKFMDTIRSASAKKPVVVLKGGRTASGDRAVKSHTGSLAGRSDIFEAAVKQSRGIIVGTLDEFMDVPAALSTQPPMYGDKVAVLTNGGGFGILAVDALEMRGFKVTPPSSELMRKLKEILPLYYPVSNPTDLTGDSTPEQFLDAGLAIVESCEYDALFLIPLLGVPGMVPEKTESMLIQLVKSSNIPIVATAVPTTPNVEEVLHKMEKKGLPIYPTPERAASSLYGLRQYGKMRDTSPIEHF